MGRVENCFAIKGNKIFFIKIIFVCSQVTNDVPKLRVMNQIVNERSICVCYMLQGKETTLMQNLLAEYFRHALFRVLLIAPTFENLASFEITSLIS